MTSSSWDYAYSIAIDGSGNVFVAGWTWNSSDFAPSRIVFGTTGSWDAFVSKLSGDLSTHIATAILTSDSSDAAFSIAIDGSGNVFIAGITYSSSDFAPDRNIFGTTSPPGYEDAFVSKLSNDLNTHIATAILTSSGSDYATSIAIDGSGNVFVAGWTWNSSDFAPSRIVFGTTGGKDAFVSRLPRTLDIKETPITSQTENITLHKGKIVITLNKPSYVGVNVYGLNGRLIKRFSFGYLPAGRYEYNLGVRKGYYFLKVRIGDKVKELKGVF